MSVHLIEAEQPNVFPRTMLDRYLRELSCYHDVALGATDPAGYPYLDAYWSEPGRHALLLGHASGIVGFALIRTPRSTGSSTHELAEFFIEPESRGLGIGRQAAAAIWQRFPGQWSLQVHVRNTAAVQFWTTSVEAATGALPQMHAIHASDGRRIQFNFSS